MALISRAADGVKSTGREAEVRGCGTVAEVRVAGATG